MNKKRLIDELQSNGLSWKGNVKEMKQRLKDFYDEKQENSRQNDSSSDTMAYIDEKIDKKFEELCSLIVSTQTQRDRDFDRSSQMRRGEHTHYYSDDDETQSMRCRKQHTLHGDTSNERNTPRHSKPIERDESMERMRRLLTKMCDEWSEEDKPTKRHQKQPYYPNFWYGRNNNAHEMGDSMEWLYRNAFFNTSHQQDEMRYGDQSKRENDMHRDFGSSDSLCSKQSSKVCDDAATATANKKKTATT